MSEITLPQDHELRGEVSIRDLKFAYGGAGSKQELILGGVDMEIKRGDFVCILGQSGCGKSTLLRLLAGLEKKTSGDLIVHGEQVDGTSLDRVMVFQDYGLFPWMSAGENIVIALKQKYRDMTKEQMRARAAEWMNNVGLDADTMYDKLPMELSGGQRQRCATARAFAMDAPIMLMDEPFGALDAVTKALLQDTVLSLWEKNEDRKTVFFVTHSVDEALILATDIYVLGQSPAKVIFTHSFKGQQKPNREEMFHDSEMMSLRNKIIGIINDEIIAKARRLEAEKQTAAAV